MVIQKVCENFMPRRFSFDFPHHEFPSMAAFNARHSPISKQVIIINSFRMNCYIWMPARGPGIRTQDSRFRFQDSDSSIQMSLPQTSKTGPGIYKTYTTYHK